MTGKNWLRRCVPSFLVMMMLVSTASSVGFASAAPMSDVAVVNTAEALAEETADLPDDNRLIVKTDDVLSDVLETGQAVQMDDVAIFSFDSESEKDEAKEALSDAGVTDVSEDVVVSVQTADTDEAGNSVLNGTGKKVALIDTGVNGIDTIDLTGEGTKDDNGHGTRMAELIETASDGTANIVSIKAIGKNGKGNLSNVYAALKIAMEQKADFINMSFNVLDSDDTAEVKALLADAIASGITAVSAAGNQNADAGLYFPGNVSDGTTVGAMTSDEKPEQVFR